MTAHPVSRFDVQDIVEPADDAARPEQRVIEPSARDVIFVLRKKMDGFEAAARQQGRKPGVLHRSYGDAIKAVEAMLVAALANGGHHD